MLNLSVSAQSLADLARQEKEKRANDKSFRKVYTNDDLSQYEKLQPSAPANPTAESSVESPGVTRLPPLTSSDNDERAWSKRFIEAKSKAQEAKNQGEAFQAKLNDLNLKMLRQTDVYDREHIYGALIGQTRQQMEKNKVESAAAQQELEDLRDALRKSGKPVSWENSQAALKADPKETKSEATKVKNEKYWQDKLAAIDKRYEASIVPLETERFQLVNRREPKTGEVLGSSQSLGMGVPPRVIDIDVQIKELNQQRQKEKQELVEQAVREGALPGWFR